MARKRVDSGGRQQIRCKDEIVARQGFRKKRLRDGRGRESGCDRFGEAEGKVSPKIAESSIVDPEFTGHDLSYLWPPLGRCPTWDNRNDFPRESMILLWCKLWSRILQACIKRRDNQLMQSDHCSFHTILEQPFPNMVKDKLLETEIPVSAGAAVTATIFEYRTKGKDRSDVGLLRHFQEVQNPNYENPLCIFWIHIVVCSINQISVSDQTGGLCCLQESS